MFAHNASNYDLHFMVKALGEVSQRRKKKQEKELYTRCLPKNSETYRSLDVNIFRFLDSLAFLPHRYHSHITQTPFFGFFKYHPSTSQVLCHGMTNFV